MAESYLEAISRFAWRRSLALTDALSIVAGVLIPAISHVTGKAVADTFGGYAYLVIAVIVVGVVGLRLATAPYFIWKEQNYTIESLRIELAKPEQSIKARMHGDLAETRVILLDQLMRIHARFGHQGYNPAEYFKSLQHEAFLFPPTNWLPRSP